MELHLPVGCLAAMEAATLSFTLATAAASCRHDGRGDFDSQVSIILLRHFSWLPSQDFSMASSCFSSRLKDLPTSFHFSFRPASESLIGVMADAVGHVQREDQEGDKL